LCTGNVNLLKLGGRPARPLSTLAPSGRLLCSCRSALLSPFGGTATHARSRHRASHSSRTLPTPASRPRAARSSGRASCVRRRSRRRAPARVRRPPGAGSAPDRGRACAVDVVASWEGL
jgi:hypothetical protein